MYEEYKQWRQTGLTERDGIIIGSDQSQEWLLPWWWEHFRRHNNLPVTFVDLGLSKNKKEWCRSRGELIPLRVADIFVCGREEVDPKLFCSWKGNEGVDFWENREVWFKKPLACLQSPYRRSIWIDLDCQIMGPLEELFLTCEAPPGFAICRDRYANYLTTPTYNSGVIVFQRGLQILETWAELSFTKNHLFRGDQDLLSYLIAEKNILVTELSSIYNWPAPEKSDVPIMIYHWAGSAVKSILRNKLALEQLST